jgi:hypothetical protein
VDAIASAPPVDVTAPYLSVDPEISIPFVHSSSVGRRGLHPTAGRSLFVSFEYSIGSCHG